MPDITLTVTDRQMACLEIAATNQGRKVHDILMQKVDNIELLHGGKVDAAAVKAAPAPAVTEPAPVHSAEAPANPA